jgi:transposase
MDTAKINCGEMVKQFIEEAGAKLIYLSPYSLEFSPSNFFSQVKSILIKLKTKNYLDLTDAIADAMLQVTKAEVCSSVCCYLIEIGNHVSSHRD